MARTLNKHIRVDEELWERLEAAARESDTTANRLLAELATQWLENREWPSTDVQIQVARSSLFAAQAIARDLIAAGREDEIDKIRRYISTIVPDAPSDPVATTPGAETADQGEEDPKAYPARAGVIHTEPEG